MSEALDNSGNTPVKPIMGNGVCNPLDQYYEVPTCPACGEVTYSQPECPFCGQPCICKVI